MGNIYVLGNKEDFPSYENEKNIVSKKIVITSKNIFDNFTTNIFKIFQELKRNLPKEYKKILEENKHLLEGNFEEELIGEIEENINFVLSSEHNTIKSDKNLSGVFLNTKFMISLRTNNFSMSENHIEKGEILGTIKKLLIRYLNFEGNCFELEEFDKFIIEIFESSNIEKNFQLKKKDKSSYLISNLKNISDKYLNSIFGGESYLSLEKNFVLFECDQNIIFEKSGRDLIQRKLEKVEKKILTNEELIEINNKTKNFNNCLIEGIIDSNNCIKILRIYKEENDFEKFSKNSILFNKSELLTDKINLISSDEIESECNNKFLYIQTNEEFENLIQNIIKIKELNGIIFGKNFYSNFIFNLAKKKNINLIFLKNKIETLGEYIFDFEKIYIYKSQEELKENFQEIKMEQKIKQNENDLFSFEKEESSKNTNIGDLIRNSIKNQEKVIKENENLKHIHEMYEEQKEKVEENLAQEEDGEENIQDFFFEEETFQDETEEKQDKEEEYFEEKKQDLDLEKYHQILGCEIIGFDNELDTEKYYFEGDEVQKNFSSRKFVFTYNENLEVENGELVLPITKQNSSKDAYFLISNVYDFFKIGKDINSKGFFVDLTNVDSSIKENFLNKMIDNFKTGIFIICNQIDIHLFENIINKIKGICFKDVKSNENLNSVRNTILSFEKRFLLK